MRSIRGRFFDEALGFQLSATSLPESAVVQDFRNLKVWRRSHELSLAVYGSTQSFPTTETYALTNQIRRAAVSISTNIAEGRGRGSDADFGRFLQMAMGSASEVEYLLLLARDLSYLSKESCADLQGLTIEVKRMLVALLRKTSVARSSGSRDSRSLPALTLKADS